MTTTQSTPETATANRWAQLYRSPIGKKLLTGLTGLLLSLFVMVHMLGNLTLFWSPAAYNQFGHFLAQIWPITALIELGLGLSLGLHISLGIGIYLGKRRSRTQAYARYKSAGQPSERASTVGSTAQPSYQSLSSRTMIGTGLVLFSFLVWHGLTFKFGVRYQVPGQDVRDLARLVIETFQQPLYTGAYLGAIALLSLHLRHGFWSAWQSLGALNEAWRIPVYSLSLLLSLLLGLGFGVLPLAIYWGVLPQ